MPVADAAPLTLPDARPSAEAGSEAGSEAGGSSAAGEPEAVPSAPEPAHAPEAARTDPEPVPTAAADLPPVRVEYNEFDMSKKAVEFRANQKDPQGLYNVAVFEYVEPGNNTPVMEAFKS